MADNAAMFLCDARQEAGRIDEGHERNVEAVTHSHEACHLIGGIDVDHACHDGWFLRYDAHTVSANACQTDDGIACPVGLEFEERTFVHYFFDDLMHHIRFICRQWHNIIERLIHARKLIGGLNIGWVFNVIRR